MIVKNEDKFILRCLHSLIGVVDEIIIVDSGSTDNKQEIITKFQNQYKKWFDIIDLNGKMTFLR
ncbi:glycosyltransferase [Bacillus salitolerans]|uniref:Glycosyltransferase n=1 Tax=Bacillus salitolerans TaxID=1437434 RepID=A0ABW4LNM6_9BACI